MIAIAILVINLILHPNSHHAMATLLSGLGSYGRRKRLKLQPLINLSCILFSNHAIATLLSGLGNDGRRKR